MAWMFKFHGSIAVYSNEMNINNIRKMLLRGVWIILDARTTLKNKRTMEILDIRQLIGEATEYDKKQALEIKKPKSWCKRRFGEDQRGNQEPYWPYSRLQIVVCQVRG